MKNRRKYIKSTYLKGVREHNQSVYFDKENNCYISIKQIIKIDKPFYIESNLHLLDNNYYIIEIVPLIENYCIRVFVNDKKEIILYYFDITLKNGFDKTENSAYYDDLYLDVVKINNDISILDKNELDEALEENNINSDEYRLAINVKDKLVNEILNNTNKYMKIDFLKYL